MRKPTKQYLVHISSGEATALCDDSPLVSIDGDIYPNTLDVDNVLVLCPDCVQVSVNNPMQLSLTTIAQISDDISGFIRTLTANNYEIVKKETDEEQSPSSSTAPTD